MANQTWAIDPTHSELHFKVKHLVITTVTGTFKEFTGAVTSDDNFENLAINFVAKTGSVDTNNEQRDGHLKGADFFDSENFPEITFVTSGAIGSVSDDFTLQGTLTIRGASKEITLNASYLGNATDPWGNTKAGFEVNGKINRSDFGLEWNAALETGGVLVSEEVKISASIQLVKQG